MISMLLFISFTSLLMIVDTPFLQYRYPLIMPPLLFIPLMSFFMLVYPPFLQYMSLLGLWLPVVNSTLDPLQSVRLLWPPHFSKWLMITALQSNISFHLLLYTCSFLPSSSTSSYFKNLQSGSSVDLPLGIFLSFKLPSIFIDRVQPKTSPFSTRHTTWVNYKVLSQLSQPIFVSFSHLNSAQHNLVI